jgi:hypothetical protein
VILTLPDNTNKQYKVPEGTMFSVDGQMQSVFHLRKGMMISATVITDSPEIHQTTARTINGEAAPPLPAAPATPQPVGVLLIEEPVTPPPAEVATNTLPKTSSMLPLIGFLGMLCVGASFGLRTLRP